MQVFAHLLSVPFRTADPSLWLPPLVTPLNLARDLFQLLIYTASVWSSGRICEHIPLGGFLLGAGGGKS